MRKDACREAFEKWMGTGANQILSLATDDVGIYEEETTRLMWYGWQARDQLYTAMNKAANAEVRCNSCGNPVQYLLIGGEKSAWQPIETAPRGKWILVADGCDAGVWMACWNAEGYWSTMGTMRVWQPSHWMPLPDRPGPHKLPMQEIEVQGRQGSDA